jgi:S-sulfosulfanyl-L-cysteine sulfohydrolase
MKKEKTLSIIQMNDSHAYFDLHHELFWQGGQAVYRSAGGYARIATLVKQIRSEHRGQVLFCDCGDTFHGTYPALQTQGEAMIPVLNALDLDAMTAHVDITGQELRELLWPCNHN